MNYPVNSSATGRKTYSLHYHDILNCTHEEVSANHLYSGRGLGVTLPEDIIFIHPLLKPEWDDICAHYRRIGLEHTQNVVWDISYQRLAEYPNARACVFYFDESIHAHYPDEAWMKTVDFMNSKNNFIAISEELGVPVPVTKCFDCHTKVTDLDELPYPCYAKAAISVSGIGIYRCENRQELEQALEKFEDGVPVQIQEEILADTFLNMQYQIEDGKLQRYVCSEQVLDGYQHLGNRYPACSEPWEVIEPVAEWMLEQGMQGVFAMDVGVVKGEGGDRYVPIECNPRFNGASYPSAIAEKLGLESWFAKQTNTSHRRLSDIDLNGLEYDPQTRKGVIIFNWGCISEGKIGFLISGNDAEIEAFDSELAQRL